jgi:hypothetical protein
MAFFETIALPSGLRGPVDLRDYAVLADDWLDEQIWPDL